MDNLDAKLSYERDRPVQQLAGLADALNGLPPEQLAAVLPIVAGVDAIVEHVRKLGVPVTTEYPENDTIPIDPALLRGLLGGTSLIRSN
ncbi:MAG: hypothetical protein ABIY55_12110 [Kofleriaceae bacterium]